MADIEIVKTGLKYHRHSHEEGCVQGSQACPYIAKGDRCFHILLDDALSVINEQQAEIDRLKAEKNRVIERIENEINILHKESRNVKDEVGTATYEWLINGFQASLDMIKDGDPE